MAQSVDPDRFFQTTDSIVERERKAAKAASNKNGNPIKLSSKVLAVLADPENSDRVWVAESAGVARGVLLSTSKISPPFRPPQKPSTTSSTAPTTPAAPLTALALLPASPARGQTSSILFAASWSSEIHAWSTATREHLFTLSGGHTDFVKCLTLLALPPTTHQPAPAVLLASGAADARIVLWDVTRGADRPAPQRVATLDGHARGVLALAADPVVSFQDGRASAALWSASSEREVRRWAVAAAVAAEQGDGKPGVTARAAPFAEPLTPHATSVTALAFSPASADLWTASADGTAACLARPEAGDGGAEGALVWTVETVLQHGATNALRAVALSADGRLVVTAGRDEDVWVWDAASGELCGKMAGHADEVCALGVTADGRVVSGSLDGTVRVWDLRTDLATGQGGGENGEEGGGDGGGGGGRGEAGVEKQQQQRTGDAVQLTAEEEAELAELMDDD